MQPRLCPNCFRSSEQRRASDRHCFEEAKNLRDLAREIIELCRRRTGRESIAFLVDEAGQYVASRGEIVLNLDGLVRTFKELGQRQSLDSRNWPADSQRDHRARRSQAIHSKGKTIQSYLWVTEKNRCWESRGLKRQEQLAIADGQYSNSERDFTAYLNNWGPIQALDGT